MYLHCNHFTILSNTDRYPLQLNHGIALSQDGNTLYASTSDVVYSYTYDATAGTVSNRKTLITGMASGGHTTRTLFLSKKSPNLLLVSRGSDGNIDTETTQVTSGRSQIRIFDVSQITTSVAYTSGEVLGWGLRNSVGVTEDPATGGIVSPLSILSESLPQCHFQHLSPLNPNCFTILVSLVKKETFAVVRRKLRR